MKETRIRSIRRLSAGVCALLALLSLTSCADILGGNFGNYPEIEQPMDSSSPGEELPGYPIPVSSMVFDYLLDRVTSYKYVWEEGTLTVSAQDRVERIYTFGSEGELLSEARCNAAGKPICLTEYDPTDDTKVLFVTRYTYDGNGALTNEEREDAEGELLRSLRYTPDGQISDGFALEKNVDESGRILAERCTVYTEGSAAVTSTEYLYGKAVGEEEERLLTSETKDAAGTLLRTVEFSPTGLAVKETGYLGEEESYTVSREYGENGKLLRETENRAGSSRCIREYDEFGNLTSLTRYLPDKDGNPPDEESWEVERFDIRYESDEEGRVVKWASYGEDGRVLEAYERGYDGEGRQIRQLFYREGSSRPYDGWEELLDGEGKLRQRTEYGPGEEAKRVTAYDGTGRAVSEYVYDPGGEALSGWECSFAPSGEPVSEVRYQAGQVVSRTVYTYDREGRMIDRVSFDRYDNTDCHLKLTYEEGNLVSAEALNGKDETLYRYDVEWTSGSETQAAFAAKHLRFGPEAE